VKSNIWILNHYAGPPEINGGIRHYKFAENLISRGYKVKIFAASSRHNSKANLIQDRTKYFYREYNGVPFIFIKARDYLGNGKHRVLNMLEYALGLMSISKIFDAERPEIIYASSVHPLTWVAGYILAKRYNAKFIAETRDLWPETLVTMGQISRNSIVAKLLYKLEEFIYKKADKLIFTMPGGKDYVDLLGFDLSKVFYINNGIDIESFNSSIDKFVMKDKDLDNNDIFRVVYTGSIGAYNGVEYLVKAAEILEDKGYKHIKILIWGNGTEKHKLEEYAAEKNLKNIVFNNPVDKVYIPSILSKSNLNLLLGIKLSLNKYGLSPNKLFDYFASGKPIISNRTTKYDIVQAYGAGITIQDESSEALAEAIIMFSKMDKNEYSKYCENALRAAKDFDFEVLTNKLEEVILS
jgi:glycosyltransferase involved in cell wall biosynthesis